MRYVALFGLLLPLGACGYDTWSNWPFTTGNNPHMPVGASENMRRVVGEDVPVQPLVPEPGDIWPGPVAAAPTLADLEKQGNIKPGVEQPSLGSPEQLRSRGSSTPPENLQPTLPPLPQTPTPSPSTPQAVNPPPSPQNRAGQVVQTPQGTGVTTGGGAGYQTMTLPGGGSAIVVPNGNGTSTVIRSDGTIETIPTPRSR